MRGLLAKVNNTEFRKTHAVLARVLILVCHLGLDLAGNVCVSLEL